MQALYSARRKRSRHVKHIGIDKAAGTFGEAHAAIWKIILQYAIYKIEQLYFFVPVPGNNSVFVVIDRYKRSDTGKIVLQSIMKLLPAQVFVL